MNVLKLCQTGTIKDTVPVGTDQNIEIEIWAEYKYTLNELLVTKIVFQYVQYFARYDEREFLPELKLYDARRTVGVNFSRHVLAETATMQRINAPSIFNIMPSNLASL